MNYSAAIMFAWKSFGLKCAEMKTWMRDSSITVPGFYCRRDVAAETWKSHHYSICFQPSDFRSDWLVISDGISKPRVEYQGVTHAHIDFSQDHNKLIYPTEGVRQCKLNSAAINAEPWFYSLHWCNTEDPPVAGGWAPPPPALLLIRECASCNTTERSQYWGKQIELG